MAEKEQVKTLRDRTGAGILACKEALEETDGDVEAAIDYLERTTGIESDGMQALTEGVIRSWTSAGVQEAVLLEINCETDFVARHDDFLAATNTIMAAIGPSEATTVEDALEVEIADNIEDDTVAKRLDEMSMTFDQAIGLRRMARMSVDSGGVGTYVNSDDQIGVAVGLESDELEFETIEPMALDLAMHIAAMAPAYVSADDIPEEAREFQKGVFSAQMEEEGKPEHIIPQIVEGKIEKWTSEVTLLQQPLVKGDDLIPKIVEGKIKKWTSEVTLLQQPFVKVDDQTVGEFLAEDLPGEVDITEFVRFEVGEGLTEDDGGGGDGGGGGGGFAREVSEMIESARDS